MVFGLTALKVKFFETSVLRRVILVTIRNRMQLLFLRHYCEIKLVFDDILANTVAREFTYEVVFVSEQSRRVLEKMVAISLVKKDKDTHTGLAKLIFTAIFRPEKPIQ